jgi:hypothetical protein
MPCTLHYKVWFLKYSKKRKERRGKEKGRWKRGVEKGDEEGRWRRIEGDRGGEMEKGEWMRGDGGGEMRGDRGRMEERLRKRGMDEERWRKREGREVKERGKGIEKSSQKDCYAVTILQLF